MVAGGGAIPSWGNPGNYLLVLLQGSLIRSLYLQANSNLLRLQNQLKGSSSSVEGVRDIGAAHHCIALYGPSA